jgi:hypothetical protein
MRPPLGFPEAGLPATDQDLLERLLDGRLDPASAPPGYGRLARLLAAATAPAAPEEVAGARLAMAEFAAVMRSTPPNLAPRRIAVPRNVRWRSRRWWMPPAAPTRSPPTARMWPPAPTGAPTETARRRRRVCRRLRPASRRRAAAPQWARARPPAPALEDTGRADPRPPAANASGIASTRPSPSGRPAEPTAGGMDG